MLSRLSFRSKLLLVLFVPFLALIVIAGAGLSDRFDTLHGQEQYGKLELPFERIHDLSGALEREATLNQWYVNSGHDGSIPIANARATTDAAVDGYRAVEGAFADGWSETVDSARARVDAGLVQLQKERSRVDQQQVDVYTPPILLLAITDNVLDLGEAVTRELDDPGITASVSGVFALEREQTELAREAAAILPLLTSGDQTAFSFWLSAIAAEGRHRQEFLGIADDADVATFRARMDRELVPDLLRPTNAATNLPTAFPPPERLVPPGAYVDAYLRSTRQIDRGVAAVNAGVADRAVAATATAREDVWVFGGLAVIAMLVTVALTWVVARAVVRPLRTLTDNAREISQVQLPQLVEQLRVGGDVSEMHLTDVKVTSQDEIGELAQAFRDVEAVTVSVAQEQSRLLRKGMGDLFVNLARRNQSLLERQLELLDDLERNEHDPAALDSLFKLDHMATRMRRNAESLLVLSGAEQPRQWQQPIALLDVVRAAAAEIADFPRVELVGIDDGLAIAGRAVADLAHLIAELLENATSFSPPDSPVVVSGAPTAAGFVLAISDQGIGVPTERLVEANELLARPPAVGLALSRALGLHVVGSLAARHAISVELRPGAPVGTVALVTLPAAILEHTGAGAAPAEPAFAPDVGSDGESAPPLVIRPVAWRPPDEPPVEEWRREGLVTDQVPTQPPASAAAPPARPAPPMAPTTQEDAVVQPTAEVPHTPIIADVAEPTRFAAPTPAPAPAPEPAAAPEPAPAPEPAAAHDELDDEQFDDQQFDDGPLPIRVPGQHLTHQPSPEGIAPAPESDPMRPYRVHEFLSRHEQGKRRGRAEIDVFDTDALDATVPPTGDQNPESQR